MTDKAIRALRHAVVATVPEGWLQKVRAYRRSDLFRREGVVFIHVPKAAGTSITDVLYGRFIGHFRLADVLSACPADVRALPRFSVVRNPWDRLVSAWAFATAGEGSGSKTVVRMHNPAQYRRSEFASFEVFVTEWLANQDVNRLDGVFRAQSSYLTTDYGRVEFDHIGRVEALAQTEEWLSDLLHRKFIFARGNTSNHEDYESYYSARSREIVGRIYARDIALFGYDF